MLGNLTLGNLTLDNPELGNLTPGNPELGNADLANLRDIALGTITLDGRRAERRQSSANEQPARQESDPVSGIRRRGLSPSDPS